MVRWSPSLPPPPPPPTSLTPPPKKKNNNNQKQNKNKAKNKKQKHNNNNPSQTETKQRNKENNQQKSRIPIMSVKLLITDFILLMPLEGVCDRMNASQGVTDLSPYDQGVTDLSPYDQGVTDLSPYDQGINDLPPYDQGVTDLSPYGQGVTDLSPYGQGVTDLSPYGQGVTDLSPYDQGVTDLSPYDQGVTDLSPYDHGVTDLSPYDQGVTDLSPYDQGVTDVSPYDHEYETEFLVLYQLVVPVVAVVGVGGNVVVLVVWSAETTFIPTTFLIKCLAVTDIITLLAVICYWADSVVPGVAGAVIRTVSLAAMFYCRAVTAHTTLGVVVTRWVAVYRPLRVHSLLTTRRVVLGYGLMLLWCLTPAIPAGLLLSGHIDGGYISVIYHVCESVYLALPILLVVVLNVSLVCRVWSRRRGSSLGQQQHTARAARSSRLFGAVLCVSITTVLAYPAGVVYRIIDLSLGAGICAGFCSDMVLVITIVLEEINASINVVYYLLFASRFRELCRLRYGYCCRRCCC